MKGYVKKRGDRYYAVIYEGLDPVTGKERRRWHPAGTNRAEAEGLAAALAAKEERPPVAQMSATGRSRSPPSAASTRSAKSSLGTAQML